MAPVFGGGGPENIALFRTDIYFRGVCSLSNNITFFLKAA